MASVAAAGIWRASVVAVSDNNKGSSSSKQKKGLGLGLGLVVECSSRPQKKGLGLGLGLVVECSSRPQKKATSHHMKTRPKKTQPWDVKRRGPTPYPPLPPLPPDWTLLDPNAPAQPESESEPVAAPNF